MKFAAQDSKPNFGKLQQDMIDFWNQERIFQKSIDQRPADNAYRFYDGPPFITGLPHYGHMASSIAKDVIPRYQTMQGKRVERIWGWDCHGIPIEQKVQKKLGLETTSRIHELGLDRFVQECASYTRSTSQEWKRYIENMGRWVDFDRSYRTMDNSYMESVWWAFKSIYEKDLMYQGKRVSMYSPMLATPISNHEVAMDNSYEEVNDPAIVVSFELGVTPEQEKKAIIEHMQSLTASLSEGYEIRLAVPEDAASIISVKKQAKILNYIHTNDGEHDDFKNITNTLSTQDQLKQELQEGKKIYVATFRGSIVGIKYSPSWTIARNSEHDRNGTHLRLGALYILPTHHKQGLGQALIDAAVYPYPDHSLEIHVKQEDTQAIQFYQELGFIVMQEGSYSHTFDKTNEKVQVQVLRKEAQRSQAQQTTRRYALAWTTTPWTIPANMALGAHTDINYAIVHYRGNEYVLARSQVEEIFGMLGGDVDYAIVDEISGSDLIGTPYKPPFEYYRGNTENSKNHHILFADFATEDSGTGIVHQAPEFGEEDFGLGQKEQLTISEAMDSQGNYTEQIPDLQGLFYRDANELISQRLKTMGRLFHKGSVTHRVAFCPRSGVPLVYKAQKSWFIDIQSVKDKLIAKNEEINRYPEHFKHGRFLKSVESAPDRCISRTRFRGTPMPLYRPRNEEGEYDDTETLVIGGRDELFTYNKPYKQLTKIILIRHGRTDYNEKHWGDDAQQDKARLNDLGVQQAQGIASTLANTDIHAVYSSPLTRCLQTLEPLVEQKGYNVIQDHRLREVDMPANNGKVFSCSEWKRDGPSVDGDTGETVQDAYKRLQEFAQEVLTKHPGETVVVCSHGDPLILLQKVFQDFDYDIDKARFAIDNKHSDQLPLRYEFIRSETGESLDMHLPMIDRVRVQNPSTGNELHRIPEVLDCWFESGSMPYGQMNYPFSDREKMENNFPADFIVEYTGQIRAWFYLMHVMGVLLFDKPAFTNVICHGVIAGNDGRKMSKSLGNYPDPKPSFAQYGGDAIRMSLVTSPLFAAGDTSITEESFHEALKLYVLPLWNAFYFFVTYARIDGFSPLQADHTRENILDQWIVGELQSLIQQIDESLSSYDLQSSSRAIGSFLDNLTNWYIRRSRRRFWKTENDTDKQQAYSTLYYVLTSLCKTAAPFMPFITEYIYRELTKEESVHLCYFPKADLQQCDAQLAEEMRTAQTIIRLGLAWRSQKQLRVRQPLPSITVGMELSEYIQDIIADELNVKKIIVDPRINTFVTKICKPIGRIIGPKYGKDVKTIISEAKKGNFQELEEGKIQVANFILEPEEYEISYRNEEDVKNTMIEENLVIQLDDTLSPELIIEGYMRDLIRHIQEARKDAGYDISQRIHLLLENVSGDVVIQLSSEHKKYIQEETLSTLQTTLPKHDYQTEVSLSDEYRVRIQLLAP